MMNQSEIYVLALTVWSFFILLFIAVLLFLRASSEIYLITFVILNSAGAFSFLVTYEYLLRRYFEIGDRNNFSKKDLTFFFLLVFGPFGLIPMALISPAFKDKARGRFAEYLKFIEFNDEKSEDFALIDITSEFKKQIFKEPVVDSLKYGCSNKKRGAIDILYKMRTPGAVSALKNMVHDREFEIRVFAINKLTDLEDDFMRELDWYSTAIAVCGPCPELMFQYGVMLMKYVESGLVFAESASLYLHKAEKAFSAVTADAFHRSYALAGLSRILRLSGRFAEAEKILSDNIRYLNSDGVDEYARCLFEVKKWKELRSLAVRSSAGELPSGRALQNVLQCHEKDGDHFTAGSEPDIYSVSSVTECLNLFDKSESLDFDLILSKIRGAMSSHMLASIYDRIQGKSLGAKIAYLKLLYGKIEPELVWIIKRFLYEPSDVLNIIAADVLTSSELPLRNEIFLALLSHRLHAVRLVAVKFLGARKVAKASTQLRKIASSVKVEKDLKLQAVMALACIGDYFSVRAATLALADGDREMVETAMEALDAGIIIDFAQKIIDGRKYRNSEFFKILSLVRGDVLQNLYDKYSHNSGSEDVRLFLEGLMNDGMTARMDRIAEKAGR